MEGEELKQKFLKVVKVLQAPGETPAGISNYDKLDFYGLFKTATDGKCKGKNLNRANRVLRSCSFEVQDDREGEVRCLEEVQ